MIRIKQILSNMLFIALLAMTSGSHAYAFPTEIHRIIAYESSLIEGVPSEINVYIGYPENCINNFRDTICEGAYDEDADRDPRISTPNFFTWLGLFNWGTHFWQPNAGPAGGRLDSIGAIPVNLESKNAYQRAGELYASAKILYNESPSSAYYLIGKVVHLLTDMGVPAHAHLDPHISDAFTVGDDSFEEFMWQKYVSDGDLAGRVAFESDFHVSDLIPADYKNLYAGGYYEEPLLFRIFYSLANESSTFDSDDANGIADNGVRRGLSIPIFHTDINNVFAFRAGYKDELLQGGYQLAQSRNKFILLNSTFHSLKNEHPAYEGIRLEFSNITEMHYLSEFSKSDIGDTDVSLIARALIPTTIEHVAALYNLFWTETHTSIGTDKPDITLNNGVHRLHITRPDPLEVEMDISPHGWVNTEVEIYAWLDVAFTDSRMKAYFNGLWVPFENFSEMRPLVSSFKLVDLSNVIWRILDNTSLIPEINFTLNLCIDRACDGYYSPAESICNGILISID